jgi:8-hydroxy-5-deazaflavin:NADPH oxidoreductase
MRQSTPPFIDTCNYYYYSIRDGIIEDIEDGMPESVLGVESTPTACHKGLQQYSLSFSGKFGSYKRCSFTFSLPIAGDDKHSKDLVSILIDNSGFDSLGYGSLQDSWRQQPGSPVYCTDLTLTQLKRSIEKARKELLPERRELGLKFILKHDPELWMDNVKHNRKIYESDLEV